MSRPRTAPPSRRRVSRRARCELHGRPHVRRDVEQARRRRSLRLGTREGGPQGDRVVGSRRPGEPVGPAGPHPRRCAGGVRGEGFDATDDPRHRERGRLTQGSLYHHFESREAILVAVLQIFSARMRDAHEAIGEAGWDTPRDRGRADPDAERGGQAVRRRGHHPQVVGDAQQQGELRLPEDRRPEGAARVGPRVRRRPCATAASPCRARGRMVFQCLGEILWSTHTLPRVSVERLTRYNLETVLWGASPK